MLGFLTGLYPVSFEGRIHYRCTRSRFVGRHLETTRVRRHLQIERYVLPPLRVLLLLAARAAVPVMGPARTGPPAEGSSARCHGLRANLRRQLQQDAGVVSVGDFVNPAFCQLLTTCPVAAGAELLLDYGREYDFGAVA